MEIPVYTLGNMEIFCNMNYLENRKTPGTIAASNVSKIRCGGVFCVEGHK